MSARHRAFTQADRDRHSRHAKDSISQVIRVITLCNCGTTHLVKVEPGSWCPMCTSFKIYLYVEFFCRMRLTFLPFSLYFQAIPFYISAIYEQFDVSIMADSQVVWLFQQHSAHVFMFVCVSVSSPHVVQAWAVGPWARGSTAWSTWSYSASSGLPSASSLQADSNASPAWGRTTGTKWAHWWFFLLLWHFYWLNQRPISQTTMKL